MTSKCRSSQEGGAMADVRCCVGTPMDNDGVCGEPTHIHGLNQQGKGHYGDFQINSDEINQWIWDVCGG